MRRAAGRSRADDAYGEPFWDLHVDASWDWAGLAMLIYSYTKSRGMVDVGCGDAKILAALASLDPGQGGTLRVNERATTNRPARAGGRRGRSAARVPRRA